jgi:probable rRNA maturation factor
MVVRFLRKSRNCSIKMEIEINNLSQRKIDEEFLRKITERVLASEKKSVSIALVDRKTMQKINKKYRGQDKATDVLSFSESETKDFLDEELFLGEVIICPEESDDLKKVLIHGLLHLLGYDHEKSQEEALKMKKKEEEVSF